MMFNYLFQTYNLNAQIGESSACATALLCGVKANFETVGLDGNGKFENCYSSFGSRVDSLAYWAQQEGTCYFSFRNVYPLDIRFYNVSAYKDILSKPILI